jgi:hypothetical protein
MEPPLTYEQDRLYADAEAEIITWNPIKCMYTRDTNRIQCLQRLHKHIICTKFFSQCVFLTSQLSSGQSSSQLTLEITLSVPTLLVYKPNNVKHNHGNNHSTKHKVSIRDISSFNYSHCGL